MFGFVLGVFVGVLAFKLLSRFDRGLSSELQQEESRESYHNWLRRNYLSNNYGMSQRYQSAFPSAYPPNYFNP